MTRLKEISIETTLLRDVEMRILHLRFEQDGVDAVLNRELPEGWDGWGRQEKIAWGRAALTEYLNTHTHIDPCEIIFPDKTLPGKAKNKFENLPGWATWTAAEAAAWIEQNVNSLAEAKQVLVKISQAIMYLRDIVIER